MSIISKLLYPKTHILFFKTSFKSIRKNRVCNRKNDHVI